VVFYVGLAKKMPSQCEFLRAICNFNGILIPKKRDQKPAQLQPCKNNAETVNPVYIYYLFFCQNAPYL
jgi:hypothetical protein